MKTTLLLCAAPFIMALAAACSSPQLTTISPAPAPYGNFGVEVQAYPAGVIPGIQARHRLTNADTITFRIAANITDRGDWGEHEDESGDGWGGGVGWRRAQSGDLDTDGWWYGARVDLWDLSIDWNDPGARTGKTDVLVLQPTVELGYGWTTKSAGRFELGAGIGVEINVDTTGEDVGEGTIFLVGLTWLP
jgi:hypothetical protein